jgi:hypothetical protein
MRRRKPRSCQIVTKSLRRPPGSDARVARAELAQSGCRRRALSLSLSPCQRHAVDTNTTRSRHGPAATLEACSLLPRSIGGWWQECGSCRTSRARRRFCAPSAAARGGSAPSRRATRASGSSSMSSVSGGHAPSQPQRPFSRSCRRAGSWPHSTSSTSSSGTCGGSGHASTFASIPRYGRDRGDGETLGKGEGRLSAALEPGSQRWIW